MEVDRTYITGKIGKQKCLLIEVSQHKTNGRREVTKQMWIAAEEMHASTPWGELREHFRKRRQQLLKSEAH